MNKKHLKSWAALCLLAASVSFISCDSKQKAAEGEATEAAAAFQVPEDAKAVTNADMAQGKTLEVEKIVFGDQQYVGDNAFEGNPYVKELWMKNGFQFVNPYSFAKCPNLEKIISEGKVPVFNDHAFEECTALKTVEADVQTVGIETFKGCTSLESVKFGNELYWIRESAFEGCTSLKQVLLSVTMSKYEENVFKGCDAIEELAIPSGQTRNMFKHMVDCKNMKTVYLLALEFHPFPENAKAFPCEQVDLYVPDAMIEQYKGDASWGRFQSIKPLSESAYYQGDCWCK